MLKWLHAHFWKAVFLWNIDIFVKSDEHLFKINYILSKKYSFLRLGYRFHYLGDSCCTTYRETGWKFCNVNFLKPAHFSLIFLNRLFGTVDMYFHTGFSPTEGNRKKCLARFFIESTCTKYPLGFEISFFFFVFLILWGKSVY